MMGHKVVMRQREVIGIQGSDEAKGSDGAHGSDEAKVSDGAQGK